MRLTREAEYALRALGYLATLPPGQVWPAGRLAEACGLPAPFLSKTLRKLARSGVLRSSRGRHRGYALARPAWQISVREILEAVEGSDVFRRCVFWDSRCSEERPCLLHGAWARLRDNLLHNLERLSLEDVWVAWQARDPPDSASVQAAERRDPSKGGRR